MNDVLDNTKLDICKNSIDKHDNNYKSKSKSPVDSKVTIDLFIKHRKSLIIFQTQVKIQDHKLVILAKTIEHR